jgi:hypothetical protein
VKQELVDRDKKNQLGITIVWSPMMESDDEASARESAQMFKGTHVMQYYDPERLVGLVFRRDVFPDAYQQALATLPEDHWLHEAMLENGPAYGKGPEWDIYMFFAREVKWEVSPPRPVHFIRHLGRVIEADDGRLSLMWIDDYSTPPVEGVLSEEMGRIRNEWLR